MKTLLLCAVALSLPFGVKILTPPEPPIDAFVFPDEDPCSGYDVGCA